MVGWEGGWLKFLLILRLSQPSLGGAGTGAELGSVEIIDVLNSERAIFWEPDLQFIYSCI